MTFRPLEYDDDDDDDFLYQGTQRLLQEHTEISFVSIIYSELCKSEHKSKVFKLWVSSLHSIFTYTFIFNILIQECSN